MKVLFWPHKNISQRYKISIIVYGKKIEIILLSNSGKIWILFTLSLLNIELDIIAKINETKKKYKLWKAKKQIILCRIYYIQKNI